MFGLLFVAYSFVAAYASGVLYPAPTKVLTLPSPALSRFALRASPLLALLFAGLLGLIGPYLLLYFLVILLFVLFVRWIRT
jgi:hypothetical protein